MALPVDIATVVVQIGPVLDFSGNTFEGANVTFRPSKRVIWGATGAPLWPRPVKVVLDDNGMGSVMLPATDQDGFVLTAGVAIKDWTYTVTWDFPDRSVEAPAPYLIQLPAAAGQVDLDLTVAAEGTGGVVRVKPIISLGSVTTLPAGSDATVDVDTGTGDTFQTVSFGIPRGRDGVNTPPANTPDGYVAVVSNGTVSWQPAPAQPVVRPVSILLKGSVDGTADNTTAIETATAAFNSSPDGSILALTGKLRYTKKGGNKAAGAAFSGAGLFLRGGNNRTVVWDEGSAAELIMDNNNNGDSTSHGIAWTGPGDGNTLQNPRVRWVTRSAHTAVGDGIHIVGYPSDSAPAAPWTYTGGTLSNFTINNPTVVNAGAAGIIIMGVSDPVLTNVKVINSQNDGVHFNACRRPRIDGVTVNVSGDDSLAFCTYYNWDDPTRIPIGTGANPEGPFAQPSLGEWSNAGGIANGLTAVGGNSSVLGIYGALDLTVGPFVGKGKKTGVNVGASISDSAIIKGNGHNFTHMGSRGVKIASPNVRGCATGIAIFLNNIDSSPSAVQPVTDDQFWRMDVTISDASVNESSNNSIATQIGMFKAYDGVTNLTLTPTCVVKGIHFTGTTKCESTSTTGNLGGVSLTGLQEFTLSDLRLKTTQNASLLVTGYQKPPMQADGTTALPLAQYDVHSPTIGRLSNNGGTIKLQDLSGIDAQALRTRNAPGTGISLIRCPEHAISHAEILYANRANNATAKYGLLLQKVSGEISKLTIRHDGQVTGWNSIYLSGGDAVDPAARWLKIRNGLYVKNDAGNLTGDDTSIPTSGGAGNPVEYLIELSTRNLAESGVPTRNKTLGPWAPAAPVQTVPSMFRATAAPTPGAAINAVGASVVVNADAGYTSIVPTTITVNPVGLASEKLTVIVTATYADGSTANCSDTFNTASVAVAPSALALADLYADGKSIASLAFKVSSNKVNSTCTPIFTVSGWRY